MRRSVRIFICMMLVGVQATAVAQLSPTGGSSIDAYLERAATQTDVPGVVAMVTNREETIYRGAFGWQDMARHRPMAPDAIFRIASMTKPVTSVAVMMLIENDRIELDDPISRFLPGRVPEDVFASFDFDDLSYTSRPARGSVTIRQLLSHTSGLGYPFSNEILLALIGEEQPSPSVTRYPLLYDPGTRWTYGESTRILGQLVETLSGLPLDRFLQERIFDPLDMRDTSFTVPAVKLDRLVTVHVRRGDALVESPNPTDAIEVAPRGDGGLFSTAADYLAFIRMLLNDGRGPGGVRILRAESAELMRENHIGELYVEQQPGANAARSRTFPLGAGRDRFGLGFQLAGPHQAPNMRSAGSLSWAGIYNTQFWVDRERGIGAVLLMQYLPFYDEIAIETLQGFEQQVYEHLE